MQNDYFTEMKDLVEAKTGRPFETIGFKEPAYDGKGFDNSRVRGSVNLMQGRYLTKKEADSVVMKFINSKLP